MGTEGPEVPDKVSDKLTAPSAGGSVSTEEQAAQWRVIDAAIHENIDRSELQISRAAALQPLSPECASQLPGYKPGMIIDNLNREFISQQLKTPWLKGKVPDSELQNIECLEFVPMFKLPTEFIHWKNRSTEGKGWHFKTLDAQDPRVRMGIFPPRGTFKQTETQKSPPVTENINIYALVLDAESRLAKMMPLVITFAKTSFKTGRKLVTMCEGLRMQRLPFFASTFWLYTVKKQNDKNQVWYPFEIARGELVSKTAPEVMPMIYEAASYLSDPDEGKARQEATINAAAIEQDEVDDGDIADATSAPQGSNEPF